MTTDVAVCPRCAEPAAAGARFCSACGSSLVQLCPSCGSAATGRFCSQCGRPLVTGVAAGQPLGSGAAAPSIPGPGGPPAARPAPPVAERRITSVLFADLVGFTPLSEARDSEDVRDLLARYFDVARVVIGRYGGAVEKFIGDAVMAVWGVPSAREDDAERAVRAALDLLDAIAALGEEIGLPQLAMRAGVVTGEVAVTLGAVGQGMVAGDAVNTAARIQAAARPGQVWVDQTTRGLTAAAVAYVDEGQLTLKGKAEPVHLYSARRVIASVGGAQRVDGLEAPFVGRDREMRLVKELFHAVLEEKRPRLVAVSGQPGVGKSRLGWEFFKHLDGINDLVRWHRGRCLAYGEGVAFWALAEMVRSRLDILEGDGATTVDAKLREGLARWITDGQEREWLAPRLQVLVGMGDAAPGAGFAREELFSAWQMFFERLITADAAGVALLFEDLQWADDGLLDFLDHLMRRSNAAIFVLTLARSELAERRPGWATDRRATPIHLEPLPEPAMSELVDGLVDDLPDPVRQTLVKRSEGIPLYAVETVRSLIDRDAVVPHDGRYVLASGADLDLGHSAPTSLQTLIAARLDLLTPDERRTVQDAAVLGLSFPRSALVALRELSNDSADDVNGVLESLVRKEILALESDLRSPERGQYRFVQAMVRTVAYETLSRRDRKTRHLRAAEELSSDPDAEAFASVIASHFIDARAAEPEGADAGVLTARAVTQLELAAERSRRLGSPAQAERHLMQVVELTDDPATALRAVVGAAGAALTAGHFQTALELAEDAIHRARATGRVLDVGRASVHLGGALLGLGRGSEVSERLIPVYEELSSDPSAVETLAVLAKIIGRSLWATAEDVPSAEMWFDRCVRLAESAELWAEVADCFSSYGGLMITTGRPTMGLGMLRVALDVAQDHDLGAAQLNVRNNLACFLATRRPADAQLHVEAGLALADRLGERETDLWLRGTAAHVYWICGEWDRLDGTDGAGPAEGSLPEVRNFYSDAVALFRDELASQPIEVREEINPQWRASLSGRSALSAWAGGDPASAAGLLVTALEVLHALVEFDDDFPSYWALMLEAACEAGGHAAAEAWLDRVTQAPRGQVPTVLRALAPYFRARLGRSGDATRVETDYVEAIAALRRFGSPLWLGLALLRYAEWLVTQGRGEPATPLLDEAEQVFAGLRATRLEERARQSRTYAIR